LGAALIAVLALAALVTATASAASQKLDLTWEVEAHQLAPAQTFDMALGSSVANERTDGPLTLATNPGTVTCDPTEFPWSGLGGVDETNDEKTDKLEMSEDYFDGACSNTTGLGTKALVGLIPDDSILNLSSKGKAELKAQSGAAPIYLIVIYSGGDECLYTTTKLKGSLSLVRSGAGNQLSQLYTNQKVKLVKEDSSPECRTKVALSAPFFFALGGEGASFSSGEFVFGHLVP
jgi:hypothetical protein